MSKAKIIWAVDPPPTGPYRSFTHRAWPSASFNNATEKPAARLIGAAPNKGSQNTYHSASQAMPYRGEYLHQADVGFDIKVYVVITEPSGSWDWALLKRRARGIKEAKQIVAAYYNLNPDQVPEAV